MFSNFISAALLTLLLANVVLAAHPRAHRDPRHSDHAQRNKGRLTRRAKQCSAAGNSTSIGTPSPVNGLVDTTWLCNGQSSGASSTVTPTGGPNGIQSWLDCGIDTPHGWNPPNVTVNQVVLMDLKTALQNPASPFHACKPFLPFFEQHALQNNLPAILLTAFSMQESGCNPATIGGAGEQGLMQITKEKCVGAPDGNCLDPNFNIGQAAKYFAESLAEDDGNIILTVGRYNGWHRNMTRAEATAAGHTSCCRCQNNLDYVMQFFNGWLLNLNAYKLKLGSIFNLAICKQQT